MTVMSEISNRTDLWQSYFSTFALMLGKKNDIWHLSFRFFNRNKVCTLLLVKNLRVCVKGKQDLRKPQPRLLKCWKVSFPCLAFLQSACVGFSRHTKDIQVRWLVNPLCAPCSIHICGTVGDIAACSNSCISLQQIQQCHTITKIANQAKTCASFKEL